MYIMGNHHFQIIQTFEDIKVAPTGHGTMPRWLWTGFYLRNSKGYWYRLTPNLGTMFRVTYKNQEEYLDKLLKELTPKGGQQDV